jgi:integrase
MSKPGWRNRKAFGFIENAPYCEPPKLQKPLPKQVTDREIIKLIEAMSDIKEFPKCVDESLRPTWWRALVLLAASTAVRRNVIFGLKWEAVDLRNHCFFVSPELDKVGHARIKYLLPQLTRLLLKIRTPEPRVFHWTHGMKTFYEQWNNACENAGVKLTLHDLKRYATQVALRSGADIATLKEFCDHSNINTTMQHYTRGDVEALIANLQLPREVWND